MRVYLAGPINGKSNDDCFAWRVAARRALASHVILDPMERDYRGREAGNEAAIVESDKAEIATADVVFVYAVQPSWGTARELEYACAIGKRVVAYCPSDSPSPWLVYGTELYRSFSEALGAV